MASENVVSSPDTHGAPAATRVAAADLEFPQDNRPPAAAKQLSVRAKVTIDAFVSNFCDSSLEDQSECNCGMFVKRIRGDEPLCEECGQTTSHPGFTRQGSTGLQ